MAPSNGFFTKDTITPRLKTLTPEIHAAVTAVFQYHVTRAESEMRAGAPWSDRTGNARAGLRAVAQHSLESHALVLFHSMPYGLWLEVRWSGRYAIIGPTMKTTAAEIASTIAAALGRLGG